MRKRPRVQVVPNLAKIRPIRPKLQKLRCARAVGRPGCIAARKDEDVSLRIHRHACSLAQIDIRRQLQKVRNRIEGNLRHSLSKQTRRHSETKHKSKHKALHGNLLQATTGSSSVRIMRIEKILARSAEKILHRGSIGMKLWA